MAYMTFAPTGASALSTAAVFEPSINTPVVVNTTYSMTVGGSFTDPFTALNTTNKTTGCWIRMAGPATQTTRITLQENSVDTSCFADILPAAVTGQGWVYARFPTPYQWTSTAAGRYRFRVACLVSGNTGYLKAAASTVAFLDTYDAPNTFGSTDNLWFGGFNNAGMTTKLCTVTGTAGVNGAGTVKSLQASLPVTAGAGIQIGAGGTLKWDNTANATLQTRGHTIVDAGGTYDRTAHPTDRTIIAKHIIDCEVANGDYFIANFNGGQIKMTGAPLVQYTNYVSGLGTVASPLVTDRPHGLLVGDEIAVCGTTYTSLEDKFVKTVVSTTSVTLSNTAGGVEAGLTGAHSAGHTIALLSRNSITASQNITRGFYFYNSSQVQGDVDVSNSQFYYPSILSGIGTITLRSGNNIKVLADNAILYGAVGSRVGFAFGGTTDAATYTGLTCYLSQSSNLATQTIDVRSSNLTFTDMLIIGSTIQGLSMNTAYSCVFNNFMGSSNNTNNNATGNTIYMFGCTGITFNGGKINAARQQAIYASGTSGIVFNNTQFGTLGDNITDLFCVTGTLNDFLFNNCSFGSTNLILNYLNGLNGSLFRYHKYQQTNNRHRWYTINGVAYSSGAGLDRTTVATVGSLATALDPVTTVGIKFEYRIPVNVGEVISVFGKFWGNSTFVSDGLTTLKAELFLPGSLTADQTFNLTKTTDPTNNNAIYRLGLVNTSTVPDVAIVRLTANNPSATVSAEAYVDDLNGGTNAISALDIWFQGQPLAFQLSPQTLGDASAISTAVWNDAVVYPSGTKGKKVNDTNVNTDVTQAKVNML